MTRKEAIEYNKNLRMYMQITDKESEYTFPEGNYIALDMAIKALEQESVLDKIRAEIIQLIQNGVLKIESGNEALFDIIDKYKAESEE